jgi:hypothetical protein
MRIVQFVRFSRFDQRYWNAVAIFGQPAFLHQKWDRRTAREIADGDLVVFAKGDADQEVSEFNGDDEYYSVAGSPGNGP